jgi:hypothetical protein
MVTTCHADVLLHTTSHDELLGQLICLDPDVAFAVLNRIGGGVRDGRADGARDDLLEGATCALAPFPREAYEDYLGYAGWFYEGWDFPAVELSWTGEGSGGRDR